MLARKADKRFSSSRPAPPLVSSGNRTRQQEEAIATNQGQPQRDRPVNSPSRHGRSQTNTRGDKKCFQCGQFGHLMYSCPERQREDRKPVLSGTGCQEVAWNKESQKYLRRGTLDGRPVQMLIDTGCTSTMVSASYIKPDKLDYCNTEKILCVHGDMVCYPTAEVNLRLGQWSQIAKVVVAPGIAVPVLLGTDIYRLTTGKPVMVTTRAQAKRKDSASENRQLVIEQATQNPKENTENVQVDEFPTEQTNEVTTEGGLAEQESAPAEQYNETTMAKLPIEQRREELLTSACQEASVEHIRE